ncbi:hypothetical protein HAX54_017043 [Datura stramonium]|uniref:Uncharacterized protein n=1 Tax=Datura stramonium TaxID=4076 RepID=A0ABS8UM71_DATST|nr:hypothetical protein [Datura stramonium]
MSIPCLGGGCVHQEGDINGSVECGRLDPYVTLRDHTARITSLRLIPFEETCLYSSKMKKNDNLLVTSSFDHSIRLWWKGHCQRSFRGHNGSVTLSDKLLGDQPVKYLQALPAQDISSSEHIKELQEGKRGMTKGTETCCSSTVSTSSLESRSMRQLSSAMLRYCRSLFRGSFCSTLLFYVVPNHLSSRADALGCQKRPDIQKGEAVVELDLWTYRQCQSLHMDPYKIVSGGAGGFPDFGCSAMAVNGCRIVTACNDVDHGGLCFQDFNNATVPISSDSSILQSKFWGLQSQNDSEEESDNDST